MTDLAPAVPVVPIAGAPKVSSLMAFSGEGIALRSLEEALVFAKAVLDGGWAPKDFKTPQAIVVAWQFGAEVGLGLMQSLQSIAVINGKPGLYGDAGKALLRSKGFDIEEFDGDEIKTKGFARCTITHPRQKPVTRTFSVEDAKKAGLWGKAGPWTQYPNRQMAWRAFWFAARDAAADVLKGLSGHEENRDRPAEPRNVTPVVPDAAERLTSLAAPKVVEAETAPAPEPVFSGDRQTWIDLIENAMLDLGINESQLANEADRAGVDVPPDSKRLADLPDATLIFMRDYLGGLKK